MISLVRIDTMGRLYYISDVSGFQVCTNSLGLHRPHHPAGPPGVNGTNGVNGLDVNGQWNERREWPQWDERCERTDGFTALASTTPIHPMHPRGLRMVGFRSVGLDLDRNGMLDASEVRQTSTSATASQVERHRWCSRVPGVNGTDGQDGLTGANGSDGTDGADVSQPWP